MKIDMNANMNTNPNATWSALELGTSAIPAIWRARIGADAQFDLFRSSFLQTRPEPATSFPCRRCGCAHAITIHAPNDIVAVCTCDPWNCDDIFLTAADIQVLELNWPTLARALCQALGLDSRPADLPLPNTRQIGSWSADAVPVILTIQPERTDFQHIIAALTARLRDKFILLAPTASHMDATSAEYLKNVGAQLFALDSHIILINSGTLQPRSLPGEMFARFRPEPKDALAENDARRVFAIMQQLESQSRRKPPSVLTVFGFYCREALSVREIARRCHCSSTTIIERLNVIQKKTGLSAAALRALSPHIDKIRDEMSDSRALKIHRPTAIYGYDETDER